MVKKLRVKDQKNRKIFIQSELRKLQFQFILRQNTLKVAHKKLFLINSYKLKCMNRSSVARIKNGCVLTGRSQFTFRLSRLSRMQMKNLSSAGMLPGVYKSS